MGKQTATVAGVGLLGIDGILVDVQVGRQEGLAGMDITGLPAASIREARHRVKAALRVAGVEWPRERVVANFAPADLPKDGSGYDLPLAVAVLTLLEAVPVASTRAPVFFGEVGLDGTLRAVPGAVSAALAARAAGRGRLYLPAECASEAAAVPDLTVVPIDHVAQLIEVLCGREEPPTSASALAPAPRASSGPDLASVRGQAQARRALEIAAAGGHNLLLVGPPGCGKTLLARCLVGILPPMSLEESLAVTRIHSVSGLTGRFGGLVRERPFRAPHATASYAALVGGGVPPRPGEVSLAHRGVLFLDETPEFSRRSLEALRAPLEDRAVAIARADRRVVYPASFSLVCAMNPCACGHLGDDSRPCRCSERQVEAYRSRLSGPLLDRIDLHVELGRVPEEVLAAAATGEPSAAVRERVVAARALQQGRNRCRGRVLCNAELGPGELERWAPLGRAESLTLVRAARRLGLTARSWHRVIKVARTLADLAGEDAIGEAQVVEALSYRVLDRRPPGRLAVA